MAVKEDSAQELLAGKGRLPGFGGEWQKVYLGQISNFLTKANYTYSDISTNGGIKYLHYGFIHACSTPTLNPKQLPDIPYNLLKNFDLLQDGDIVITDVSEDRDGIGKSVSITNCQNYKVISGLHTIALRPDSNLVCVEYSPYLLLTNTIHNFLSNIAVGTKVFSINKNNISSIPISLPPLQEQKAIASALSDIASLITSLEGLIAKKRLIKQGAMQGLLTGKRRLPGFEGEWGAKTFKNVAPLQRGYDLPAKDNRSGPYPVIGSNGIIFHHNQCKCQAPGVITGRSGTIGSVFYVNEDYWPHNTTLFVTNFFNNHPKFIYYLYSFYNIKQYSNGSGVPTLNRNDIHEIEVRIPIYAEQHAIAAVLSDMDAEIAALEARLEKTRQLKAGMMNELLTGRIRLL